MFTIDTFNLRSPLGEKSGLVPMLELIDAGKQTIASVMNEADHAVAELLLKVSAQQIAGAKQPGRHAGEVLWHGSRGADLPAGAKAQGESTAALQPWRARGGDSAV